MADPKKKERDPVSRPYTRLLAEPIPPPPPRLPTIPADDWVFPEYSLFHWQRGVRKVPKPKAKAKVSDFVRMQALVEKDRQKEAFRALRRDFEASKEGKAEPNFADPWFFDRELQTRPPDRFKFLGQGREKHKYLTEEKLEGAERILRYQKAHLAEDWNKRVKAFWENEKTRSRTPTGSPTRNLAPPPPNYRP